MDKGFHSLVCLAPDLLVSKSGGTVLHLFGFVLRNDLFQFFKFQFLVVVVPCHARIYAMFILYLLFDGFHPVLAIFHIFQKVQHLAQI